MFSEITKWSYSVLFVGFAFAGLGIYSFVASIKEWLNDKHENMHIIFLMGVLCCSVSLALVGISKTTTRESVPIEYELKEPLEINVDRGFTPHMSASEDSNGLKIVNSRDYERMIDHVTFNKGDTIKIKTIEEYDLFSERKDRSWRNARVYMIWEDELLELSYDDITKQGIDKLLISIYNEV